jgi:hypothetical protein
VGDISEGFPNTHASLLVEINFKVTGAALLCMNPSFKFVKIALVRRAESFGKVRKWIYDFPQHGLSQQ